MAILIDYLQILEVEKYCTFYLSLARGLDYYTVLMHDTILTQKDEVDSFLGEFKFDNLIGILFGK
jgi:histidyl-tRNA synthetase